VDTLPTTQCPNWSSAEFVVPIVYGYPFDKTVKEFYEGKALKENIKAYDLW